MAAIQKIRSYGVVLIVVVGLALFAFIAEELVRAISTTRNIGRQVIGEIYGKSVNYQEFNALYEEYENAVKMGNGGQNLTEAQSIQLHDQVWNDLVSQRIIEHEAKALGIEVSDEEVQYIINTGSSPLLNNTPFVNQQTGLFDANLLKQFLSNYDEVMSGSDYPEAQKESFEQLMKYWQFIEKQVRQQALVGKYQTLLSGCLLSNPVSAQAAFDARNNVSTVLLASVPYTSIKDTDVQPSEAEIKAKYEEMSKQYPDMFNMMQEARDIKYIAVPIEASKADEEALNQELREYAQMLEDGSSTASAVVRESRSSISYNAFPVSKSSLPADVANIVDSLEAGSIYGPYPNASDHTLNLVQLISRTQMPDSVSFRRLQVAGTDDKAKQTVDSIMTVLQAGVPIDSVAKSLNQSAEEQWFTSAMVDGAQLNEENLSYVNTVFNSPAGSIERLDVTGGTLILLITDRRNIIDKYDVAVVKRTIEFSDDTHNDVWNKFSSFLAANTTQADIEASASQNGYTVRETQYLTAGSHYIANISGTTDALRWTFDKAKKGDISELYECGSNNNELLVVMLTDIHKKGMRSIDDANLRSVLEQEVIKDKKAEQLLQQTQGAKSLAEVMKVQGAVQDTVSNITFAAPVFVMQIASSEPALSGAVTAAKKGDFVTGVRGENAVYAFQVTDRRQNPAKLDLQQEQSQQASTYARNLNGLMSTLVRGAKIVDNRYKFYQ
ncbi:MAG: SurA N-terminal domain-containing protein [Prevotellaceae bacterium]|nr:SurA N-terminal domain-containing protein [Prevotellaceae bacterium]MCD8304342.1 SurA N-terminal domain-containing protein [Prevotellaceae bacterium]